MVSASTDVLSSVPIKQLKVGGFFEKRFKSSLEGRLYPLDEDMLLSGFESRPGKQAWIGEHIGKWIDASVKTAVYFKDKPLMEKVARVARRLIKTQELDGYLGTYLFNDRWRYLKNMGKANWDVWVHKYCITGLLTYYQYPGDRKVLAAAEKAAELIVRTFGQTESDMNLSAEHFGLPSTAILKQFVDLWQITRKKKYLDFAKWIVSRMEISTGSHLISTLRKKGSVEKVGNGKSYEMMSNFKGLLDLARVTGEKEYISLIQYVWQDILANHTYVTGGMSTGEFFMPDHYLPNDGKIEPCVTVTWIQLSLELLKLTGKSCYADAAEQTFYNQLLFAQHPSGQWYEHSPIHGRKKLIPHTGLHCCSSSGPRVFPVMLENIFCTGKSNSIYVNFFIPSSVVVELPSGGNVEIQQETDYPVSGKVAIKLHNKAKQKVRLYIRIPVWCTNPNVKVQSEKKEEKPVPGKYFYLDIPSNKKEIIKVSLDMPVRIMEGGYEKFGSVSILRGPVVYALDAADIRNVSLSQVVLDIGQKSKKFQVVSPPKETSWKAIKTDAWILPPVNRWDMDSNMLKKAKHSEVTLIPFAFAGNRNSEYRIWIPGKAYWTACLRRI